MKFSGEKVLLANAWGPIGRSFVDFFVKEGAQVVATVRFEEEARELQTFHSNIAAIVAPETREEFKSVLEPHLPIQRVVSIHLHRKEEVAKPVFQFDEEAISASQRARGNHAYLMDAIFSDLVKRKMPGSIIHLLPISVIRPNFRTSLTSYVGASFASLSKSIALEGGCNGIRSNTVNVGLFPPAVPNAVFETKLGTRAPISRPVTMEDIMPLVCLLLSDGTSMITGRSIPVDGGFLLA